MTTSPTNSAATWQDVNADAASRLDALVVEMTLSEKVAQLGRIWLGFEAVTGHVAPMQHLFCRKRGRRTPADRRLTPSCAIGSRLKR